MDIVLTDFLTRTTKEQASDIFLIAGLPLSYKKNGQLYHTGDRLTPQNSEAYIREIYHLAYDRDMSHLLEEGDDDFSFSIPHVSRFRVNTYRQRGSLAAVIRIINFSLPTIEELHIPEYILELGDLNKGLVLVTGPAGSGKSNTLACVIDHINKTKSGHIITLEDPIEFLHPHQNCIVSQREIMTDAGSYLTALRSALRQAPDVILLGEMRDHETIQTAMTAAETGHLVLSTLHTSGAANTIDRIIDAFPPEQQHQIGVQLSMVLKAVVSQQLLPSTNGGLIPAFEIMTLNPAIRNMIREHKIHQIDGILYAAAGRDMISMDNSLYALFRAGFITRDTALSYASNPSMLEKKLI